jgi:hypothetical protein
MNSFGYAMNLREVETLFSYQKHLAAQPALPGHSMQSEDLVRSVLHHLVLMEVYLKKTIR